MSPPETIVLSQSPLIALLTLHVKKKHVITGNRTCRIDFRRTFPEILFYTQTIKPVSFPFQVNKEKNEHRSKYTKQLLNEVEHDIENYQGRGLPYPPKPKAGIDSTIQGLDNSRYHAKTEFNNCFIMYSKPKIQRTIQMEHTKISYQVNWYNILFNVL